MILKRLAPSRNVIKSTVENIHEISPFIQWASKQRIKNQNAFCFFTKKFDVYNLALINSGNFLIITF